MSKKKGHLEGIQHVATSDYIEQCHWDRVSSKTALTDLLCIAAVFPELQLLNKISLGTQGKESSTFYL